MTTAAAEVADQPVPRLALSRYRSGRFLRLYAIGLCLAILASLTVSLVSLAGTGDAGTMRTDFVAYYSAAHLTVASAGSHIYNLAAFGHVERALVYPLIVRNGVLPYVYPPYLAVLMAPLGALPYGPAWGMWLAINCALLVATIASLQRYLALSRSSAVLLWASSLSFLPVFVAAIQGQTSILLLALFTGAFLTLRARHPSMAGVLLSLTLIKPQYALPFLMVLGVRRHWQALAAFTVAGAALFVIPMVLLGPGIDPAYARMLRLAGTWHNQFGYQPHINQSVAGFAQLLLAPGAATIVSVAIGLGAIGGLARVSYRAPSIEIPVALAAVVALCLSPHVLVHDLSLLVLPAAIAVRFRAAGPRHLGVLLTLGYLAVLVGLRLSAVAPIQVSVLAMLALGIWLYRAGAPAIPSFLRRVADPWLRGPMAPPLAHPLPTPFPVPDGMGAYVGPQGTTVERETGPGTEPPAHVPSAQRAIAPPNHIPEDC